MILRARGFGVKWKVGLKRFNAVLPQVSCWCIRFVWSIRQLGVNFIPVVTWVNEGPGVK